MINTLLVNMNNYFLPKPVLKWPSTIECIENLINIEKNKQNNENTIKLIIGSFSSDLTIEQKNYLNEKYLSKIKPLSDNNNHTLDNDDYIPNKRRRTA